MNALPVNANGHTIDVTRAPITLEEVIDCIRRSQGVPTSKFICTTTTLERDLGITGDDGDDLLLDFQRRFGVSFAGDDGTLREAFSLQPNEYLFHSEGWMLFANLFGLFGIGVDNVKPLTVGELHRVIVKCAELQTRDTPSS